MKKTVLIMCGILLCISMMQAMVVTTLRTALKKQQSSKQKIENIQNKLSKKAKQLTKKVDTLEKHKMAINEKIQETEKLMTSAKDGIVMDKMVLYLDKIAQKQLIDKDSTTIYDSKRHLEVTVQREICSIM